MRHTIDDLRDHLFATLDQLRDPDTPMDLDRAREVANIARVIVESAKVEVECMKVSGARSGTGFVPDSSMLTEADIIAGRQAALPRAETTTADPTAVSPHADVSIAGCDDPQLVSEIARVLSSGASYDTNDVTRNVRGAFPVIEKAVVLGALEQMVRGGTVERIPVSNGIRYRKLPRSRKEARLA